MLLAVAMAVCLGVGAVSIAWADGSQAGSRAAYTSASVTLTGVKHGDTVRVYKVVGYSDDYNSYVFSDHFGEYINELKGDSSISPEAWLNSKGEDGIAGVIEGFMDAKKAENAEDAPTMLVLAGENETAVLSLEPGYYIFYVETTSANLRIYRPVTAFVEPQGSGALSVNVAGKLLSSGQSVEMKSTAGPILRKQVKVSGSGAGNVQWGSTATTQVGDDEKFYLKVTLPDLSDTSAYADLDLKIVDDMQNIKLASKTIGKPGLRAYCKTASQSVAEATPCDEVIVESSIDYDESAGRLSFELDEEELKNLGFFGGVYNELYIAYETVSTEGVAEDGFASNSASLQYTTNSNRKSTVPETTTLFAYNFELFKVDASSNALSGASFRVYRGSGADPVAFVRVTDPYGDYYRLATAEDSDAVKVTTLLASDGSGCNAFMIKGLDAGKYRLEETVTPDGYYKPAGDFEVQLVAGMASNQYTASLGSGSSVTALKSGDAGKATGSLLTSGTYSVTVKNSKLPSLPTTGGAGLIALTVAGVVLMVAGGAYFALRRKSQR